MTKTPKTAKPNTHILQILKKGTIDAEGIALGHLEYVDYREANKYLEIAGLQWNKEKRKHVFVKAEAQDNLQTLISGGELIDQKRELQAYYTPRLLADEVTRYADLWPGMAVLEPSAGAGAIVDAIFRVVPQRLLNVQTVEMNPEEAQALKNRLKLETVINADFLEVKPGTQGSHGFDRVVMNPPFTADQDIDHVLHAFQFLKEGGRLISIVSQGFLYDSTEKRVAFRNFLQMHGRVIKHVDSGAFRSSGTMVKTVIIELIKPFSN